MPIYATNKKSEGFDPIEAGSYPARIYSMIQIGTVEGFQGQLQNKVRISFELPTEMMVFDPAKGEQPRSISQDYTLSFHEKAKLRKVIQACDPKALELDEDGFMEEFDIEQILGKELLVTIAQKPKKDGTGNYAFIDNCTRLPKGMVCPPAINPTLVLSYGNWNEEVFQKLPEFIRTKMESSLEYKEIKGLSTPDEHTEGYVDTHLPPTPPTEAPVAPTTKVVAGYNSGKASVADIGGLVSLAAAKGMDKDKLIEYVKFVIGVEVAFLEQLTTKEVADTRKSLLAR